MNQTYDQALIIQQYARFTKSSHKNSKEQGQRSPLCKVKNCGYSLCIEKMRRQKIKGGG